MFHFSSKIALSSLPLNRLRAEFIGKDLDNFTQIAKSLTFDTHHTTSFSWVYGLCSFGINLELSSHFLSVISLFNKDIETIERNKNNQNGLEMNLETGPYWHYSDEKFNVRLSMPFCGKNISLRHIDEEVFKEGKYNKFIPSWGLRTNFSMKWSSIWRSTLAISKNENEGKISDFINEPIYTDYRTSTTLGSGIFSHTTTWMAVFTTNFRDVVTGWFGNIKLTGREARSNRTKTSDLNFSSITDSFTNIQSKSQISSASLTISKLIGRNTLGMELTGQISSFENIRNQQLITSCLSGINMKMNASLVFFNHILEIYPEFNFSLRNNRIKASSSPSYHAKDYKVKSPIFVYPLKFLELKLTPYFFLTDSKLVETNRTFLLNASVSWKYKKIETNLSLLNITNCKSQAAVSVNSLYYVTSTILLKGLEALLTIKYDF